MDNKAQIYMFGCLHDKFLQLSDSKTQHILLGKIDKCSFSITPEYDDFERSLGIQNEEFSSDMKCVYEQLGINTWIDWTVIGYHKVFYFENEDDKLIFQLRYL